MRARCFEFVGGGSEKFWQISHNGSEVTVHFGRMGTHGQTQTKDLGSEDAAADHIAKLVREKLAKGYREVDADRAESDIRSGASGIKPTGYRRPPVLPPYQVPRVPDDGPAEVGGVRLPNGRRLSGDESFAPRGIEMIVDAPVIWATDAPVANAGAVLYQLREPAAAMGLVAVLLGGMPSDPARPWDRREFSPTDPRRVDWFDTAQELAHAWSQCFDEEDEESVAMVEPFGIDFPGLAAPPAVAPPSGFARLLKRSVDVSDDRAVLAALTPRRIGLIAAARPADAITAIGWSGAANVHQDPASLSAVLRSWEDRFGARLVEIGSDTLTLSVGNPPRDRDGAIAVAAEHFAFCPDNIWQGAGTLIAYAAPLQGSRVWSFWWD